MEISLQIFFSMQAGGEGRRTRPQDLTRLYEIILQNCVELQQLPGLEDDLQYQQEIETKTKAYRAFRYSSKICFFCIENNSSPFISILEYSSPVLPEGKFFVTSLTG
jgi:signal recognition particle subunit SRP68